MSKIKKSQGVPTPNGLSSESQDEKRERLLKEFTWGNDDENIVKEIDHPLMQFVQDIDDCAGAIIGHIKCFFKTDYLKTENIVLGQDNLPIKIYLPLDNSIHKFLQDRWDYQWSDASRLVIFSVIDQIFQKCVNGVPTLKRYIEGDLDNKFPSQKKRHCVSSIELIDDETNKTIGVEINVRYSNKKN